MEQSDKSTIPAFWPERIERTGFHDMLKSMGVPGGVPSWALIEREAQEVRQLIEDGTLPWPPKAGLYRELLNALGRPEDPPRVFTPHHFACFVGLPTITHVAKQILETGHGVPMPLLQQALSTTLHELYHLSRWRHFGRRVYVLERDTFELLANSDLPDMPAEHLAAPLPHFYVRFPDGVFQFDVSGDPAPQPAEGVMVGFDHADPGIGRTREISFLITGRSELNAADDNVAYVSAIVRPETPLSKLLMPDAKHAVEKVGREALSKTVPRAIVALCLYLQSEHPELEPVPPRKLKDPTRYAGKKRRRIERENERLSALGYIRVGRPLENVPGVKRDAEGKWRLEHQVWVRGHWRWQTHGPRHSLRKLIFIRPHLRGPDLAESVTIRAARVQAARRRGTG